MGKDVSKPAKVKNALGVKISGTAMNQKITLSHGEALQRIFGTDSPDMANALMAHCIKVLKGNEATDEEPAHDERAFMLAAIVEIKPRDGIERMLSVQMAATHVALVRSARWLANTENIDQVTTCHIPRGSMAVS
jgi:hypothetical protein